MARGYSRADLGADLLAGLVVGVVALPFSMALAIATGVAPQHGLATAIVAGGLIALLGGSKVQVSGPTAAFVVILAPITARFDRARTSSRTTECWHPQPPGATASSPARGRGDVQNGDAALLPTAVTPGPSCSNASSRWTSCVAPTVVGGA